MKQVHARAMTKVGPEWLKALIPKHHGAKAEFARKVGMPTDHLSKALSGTRSLKPHEIARIMSVSGPEALRGLSEDAAPYTGPTDTPVMQAARIIAASLEAPDIWVAQAQHIGLCIARGDILVIDLKRTAKSGDTVVAHIYDEAGDATTEFRTVHEDLLIPSEHGRGQPVRHGGNGATIRAVVCAVLRG